MFYIPQRFKYEKCPRCLRKPEEFSGFMRSMLDVDGERLEICLECRREIRSIRSYLKKPMRKPVKKPVVEEGKSYEKDYLPKKIDKWKELLERKLNRKPPQAI